MSINFGLVIVIIAVLIFYLRLIIIQRERAKRLTALSQSNKKKKKLERESTQESLEKYSVISKNRRNWIIAGAGLAAIVIGIVLYLGLLPISNLGIYWWIPTALGIVAFSWAFQL